MNRNFLRLFAALALGVADAHAAGLGQMQVKSRLNEPLLAEIPLIDEAPGDAENLQIRLAPPSAFARAGLDMPRGNAANLKFAVVRNARGQSVIRVTTPNQVDEPFLNFLLEVDWGRGGVVREFTVLLDPPYIAPAILKPATDAPVTVTAGTPPVPVPAPPSPRVPAPPALAAAPPPPVPTPAPAPVAPASEPVTPGQYGPIAGGETLSAIASGLRPQDVSLNQMMIALQQANPSAFIGGNINLVKRGAVLRIPGREALVALSRRQADALVREQVASWRQMIAPVPQPVATTDAAPDTRTTSATPASPIADARLQIVPPSGDDGSIIKVGQSGASAGGAGSELRAELGQIKEDLATRDAEVRELRSRVGDLEKLNADQNKLIEFRDSELAALQQRLKELQAREAGMADSPAAVAEATPAAAQAPQPAPTSKDEPLWRRPWFLGGLGVIVVGLLALLVARRRGERKPIPRHFYDTPVLAADAAASQARVDADDAEQTVSAPTAKDRTNEDHAAHEAWGVPEHVSESAAATAITGEATTAEEAFADADFGQDAVATKLELARAYLDIGDAQAAREMLDEVVAEGSPEQRDEAHRLLSEIR